jgi:hypothetical protein
MLLALTLLRICAGAGFGPSPAFPELKIVLGLTFPGAPLIDAQHWPEASFPAHFSGEFQCRAAVI